MNHYFIIIPCSLVYYLHIRNKKLFIVKKFENRRQQRAYYVFQNKRSHRVMHLSKLQCSSVCCRMLCKCNSNHKFYTLKFILRCCILSITTYRSRQSLSLHRFVSIQSIRKLYFSDSVCVRHCALLCWLVYWLVISTSLKNYNFVQNLPVHFVIHINVLIFLNRCDIVRWKYGFF